MAKSAYVAASGAVIFVGFAVWILGGWSATGRLVPGDLVLFALAFLAFLSAVIAAYGARGRARVAWGCLAVGLLGWLVGDGIWNYYELRWHAAPFPTATAVAYLLLPIGACLAMLLLPGNRSRESRGRMLIDGLIVAGSFFLVSWMTILRPMFETMGSGGRLEFAVLLAYPVSDVVILTVAAVILNQATGAQRRVLTVLTLGVACIAVADSGYAYLVAKGQYASGHLVDIGWAAGLVLVTIAAWLARKPMADAEDAPELPSWASIWMPYAPLLLAAIVTTTQPLDVRRSQSVAALTGLLVAAVLFRQYLSVRENRRLLAVVAEQANTDPLTGLGNRALFNQRLEHAVQLHERGQIPLGLIMLDLNGFKLVNDTLGHQAGDALLRGIAGRLRGAVRSGDTVARLGGDEFAVLVEDSSDNSKLIAHRVRRSFDAPFSIGSEQLKIRPSVGVAVLERGTTGVSAEELIRRADVAMYSAKRSCAEEPRTFTPDMQVDDLHGQGAPPGKPGPVGAEGRLLADLRRAIEEAELVVYYQPKYDLRSTEIVGVEALVRWPHRERGMLTPHDFLHLVRQHDLMWPMTELVVNKALDDAVRWRADSVAVPVAVNLFAPLLADLALPSKIAAGLSDRRLSSDALTLELTEDLLLGDLDRTRAVIEQLRNSGIRIAIDDFGQAYSTFSYLRDLPVDEVKLDYGFVATIASDRRAAVVAQAILGMAHKLGMTTVAEGVVDGRTAALLRDFGCDYAQGYHYSPPVNAEDMAAMLKASSRDAAGAAKPAS